eukprot:218335_1
MVGQNESKRLLWIWLHHALGWEHVYFLNINIDENGQIVNTANHDIYHRNDHINATSIFNVTNLSYLKYLQIYYKKHEAIIDLISHFCGHLFGWKPPWITYAGKRLYSNLKMYKKIYSYPSQSLMDDIKNADSKRFMQSANKNNILSDCIIVSTKSYGYWLGNMMSGHWYELGLETPLLKNLHNAISRGSMSIDLFPRSDRLYFGGGLVCSMPISTVVELELDSMKLGILSEMENARAYLAMTFFPDSIVFIGGTNCWNDVYKIVEKYDLVEQKWQRLKSIHYPRYGHSATTINERYIFIAGGCDRFYSIMNCELYDRKYNKWHKYGSMLKPAQKCHTLKYKDDIFVVGAKDRTVQIFNFEKKQWRFGNKLNYVTSKRGCKLCTIDYKLIAMNKDDITQYQIYDENCNRWYTTSIREHPINKLYPPSFMHCDEIFDWFHLGRRYW